MRDIPTYPIDIEAAIRQHYSCAAVSAARNPLTAERVERLHRWRENLHCAGCGERIVTVSPTVTIGHSVFHRTPCAARASARSTTIVTMKSDPIVGVLEGVAVPIGVRCHVQDSAHGWVSEQFASGAFDASVAQRAPRLAVGHGAMSLRGAFSMLAEECGELRFRFLLRDGQLERTTFAEVQRGEIRGCSIEFRRGPLQYRGAISEYRSVTLTGIGLCRSSDIRPAWYGTWVAAR